MPFISPLVQKELAAAREYSDVHGGACLFCRLLEKELSDKSRLVSQNQDFVTFVPYAARFPAEVWISPRRHMRTLLDLTQAERASLAESISIIRRKYDGLYGFMLPLMMSVRQAPLRQRDAPYHLYVQFLPLQRSATKLKYLASIETAYGTYLADTAPEEMAEMLRVSDPRTDPYSGS